MDENIIPNVEPFECPICYGDIDIGEGVTLRECLHNFCRWVDFLYNLVARSMITF